jgi:hypothetical protein
MQRENAFGRSMSLASSDGKNEMQNARRRDGVGCAEVQQQRLEARVIHPGDAGSSKKK